MNRPKTIPSVVAFALILSACASEQIAQTVPPPASVLAAPVPTDIGEAVDLAKTQRGAGDFDGATATLSQLVLVAPDDPRVLGEYGKILLDRGATNDALAFLQRAIELNPGEWSFYSAQGVAFAQSGDFRSAQIAFGRALMLKPGDPVVLNNFALAHLQAGNLDQAEALLLRAVSSGDSLPKVAQNLAMVRQMRSEARTEAPAGAVAPTALPSAPLEGTPETNTASPVSVARMPNSQESLGSTDIQATEVQETAEELAEEPNATPTSDASISNRADEVEGSVEKVAAQADEPIIENEMIETFELETLETAEDYAQDLAAEPQDTAIEKQVAAAAALDTEEAVSDAAGSDIWVPSSGPIYLQVGAFAAEENAARLVEKLGALEAQIASANMGERMIHRVIVGPYADRDETHAGLGSLKEIGISDVQVLTRIPGEVQRRDEIAAKALSGAEPDDLASESSSIPEGSPSLSYAESF